MCRRNQLLGLGLLTFGLGLLVGCWLSSEFVRNCFGVVFMASGILVLQKK